MGKSISEISDQLSSFLRTQNPNVDTSEGTVLRDVFINAPSIPISALHSRVDIASRAQSPESAFTDRELEQLAKNWGIFRKSGFKAKGTITFLAGSNLGVAVNAGTVVSTKATAGEPARKFITTQASSATWVFDATLNKYVVSAPIEAFELGVNWVVPNNTIILLVSTIANVVGCYNIDSTFGGTDRETLESLRARIKARIRGNSIGTVSGYYLLISGQTSVEDTLVVGAGDPAVTRGEAGVVDAFVIGNVPAIDTETFVLTAPPYADIIPTNQPVNTSVVAVVSGSSGLLEEGVAWEWAKDTGARSGSIKAVDKIQWIGGYGDPEVTVSYQYNSLVIMLQNLVNQPDNKVIGVDVLIREAAEVPLVIAANIRVFPGYDSPTVRSNVASAIVEHLSSYTMGQDVDESDILVVIANVVGVDAVVTPLAAFRSVDETITKDASGTLVISNTSYVRGEVITINGLQ